MPLMQCTVDGKPGWKWGRTGKCYTGKNGKKQALSQMKAIKASQTHRPKTAGRRRG